MSEAPGPVPALLVGASLGVGLLVAITYGVQLLWGWTP